MNPSTDPEVAVQRQLNAYNARDVEGFISGRTTLNTTNDCS